MRDCFSGLLFCTMRVVGGVGWSRGVLARRDMMTTLDAFFLQKVVYLWMLTEQITKKQRYNDTY
jgi:hypothetical protein